MGLRQKGDEGHIICFSLPALPRAPPAPSPATCPACVRFGSGEAPSSYPATFQVGERVCVEFPDYLCGSVLCILYKAKPASYAADSAVATSVRALLYL